MATSYIVTECENELVVNKHIDGFLVRVFRVCWHISGLVTLTQTGPDQQLEEMVLSSGEVLCLFDFLARVSATG